MESTRMKNLLRYDPNTGNLFWLPRPRGLFHSESLYVAWNNQWADKPALNYLNPNGYLVGSVLGKHKQAHRVAWELYYGETPSTGIDHKDGVRSNNKIDNLRLATKTQNGQNRKSSSKGTSKFLGVYWHKQCKKWCAQIKTSGVRTHLGLFDTDVDAALAYDEAATKYHGEFANLNFNGELWQPPQ